ncbi:glycosyltransferase involved in cell wall biosynthesis [Rhodanobacter sp. ANJX3]|uniref:methyltransferase domain-containing protein n=1 Tax=unclassified Rhodanobacter TaxID=2621553 RepID=UPI0015C78602|nr:MULTISPECIES: methyltransferase domain-containing protein [unclassified Rhodanobacter]MBB5360835.1 glycosyltransferase involved in cell wall biosynthesis [Rhodanobacter sp. ANJX3]NYE30212.1 glycosyltransferase involved in cell wall biosynthesis [Rhodanobacter sp. K2T2]
MSLYQNPYHHDNVYGHVIALLKQHTAGASGVHIDIGCNVAAIAEHVRDDLHREYIGFDIDGEALSILSKRGFAGHHIDLSDVASAKTVIEAAVYGSKIASITIIDTLEHITTGPQLLSMLSELAKSHGAPLVSSVPNVAHRDVGFKLALGKWDYTTAGLLDHTHVHLFTDTGLRKVMRLAGWHQIAAYDVLLAKSDQHFPPHHPAVASASALHGLLTSLRDAVDDHAQTNQLVRMWLPGPSSGEGDIAHPECDKSPFLSVVTRTQGRRIDTLRDVLLCLSAQTDQDFELCIIGHKLNSEDRLAVERIIENTHLEMRERIRLIKVDSGNRTHPLNVGFREARGEYVAILDDDDIVLGHWVEEFKKLATKTPGAVLRAGNVAQLWRPVKTAYGTQSVRAVGSMDACFPLTFDHLNHLVENASPPVSLAFPRSAYADLCIVFDETLTTTEDWDFLLRTAAVCGVASAKEITSIYRRWDQAESSYTVHSQEEWLSNHHAIWRKLDSLPLLLGPGSATRIRQLVADYNARHFGTHQVLPHPDIEAERYENAMREDIHNLLQSRGWRFTSPIRFVAALLGRPNKYPMLWAMRGVELEQYKKILLGSFSYRVAKKLRRFSAHLPIKATKA